MVKGPRAVRGDGRRKGEGDRHAGRSAGRLPAFSAEAGRRRNRYTGVKELTANHPRSPAVSKSGRRPGRRWETHGRHTGFVAKAGSPPETPRMLLTITTTHRPALDL